MIHDESRTPAGAAGTRRAASGGTPTKHAKPTFLEEQRSRRPWLDHLVRAAERFQKHHGDFYAGGITYYSVLSIFPILMVAFAIVGVVLAGNPALLAEVRESVAGGVEGGLGETLNKVIDQAIDQRHAVGVIGLLTALYSGLGWMGNLRMGLTAQWEQEPAKRSFLVTKGADLFAFLGLLLALGLSLGISAVAGSPLIDGVLGFLRLDDAPGMGFVLQVLALALSVAASWIVFAWMICYLPRERVALASGLRAALIGAVVFEVFKQIATVYLKSVMSSPAGATFGPVIGIMVFLFFTWRIVLFCTAWAATSRASLALVDVEAPAPVVIEVRNEIREAPDGRVAAALLGAGALLGVGVGSWFAGRRRSGRG